MGKRKSCDNNNVATKCPKSCGKCGSDDENEDENEDEEVDNNYVLCPGFPTDNYCDCQADCVENPSLCACGQAQQCCGVDDEDEEEDEDEEDDEDDEDDEEGCPPDEKPSRKFWTGKFKNGKPEMKKCKWLEKKKDKGKNIKKFCNVDSEDSGLSTANEA